MASPIPVWTAGVDEDGRLHLSEIGLFRAYCKRLKGQPVHVTVKKATRRKSHGQLGLLWGVWYPLIAEELGYRQYEVSQLHDAFMRRICGEQPEPNPLHLRKSLSTMTHEQTSQYLDDLRMFCLDEFGIILPEPEKAEAAA